MHKLMAATGFALAGSIIGCSATDQTTDTTKKLAEETVMLVKKATPVLITDDVAACIEFWKPFGFEVAATVPEGDSLGFAMLTNGGTSGATTIMYQSRSSAEAQNPDAAEGLGRTSLYLDVSDYDAALAIARTHPIVVDDHKTDYGTQEIYIRDPAGNLIGFAGGGE